jgi:hypothetical protein
VNGRGWAIVAVVIAGCSSRYGAAELPDAASTADASTQGSDAGVDAYDATADALDASDATDARCPFEQSAPPAPLACPPTYCFDGAQFCCVDDDQSTCSKDAPQCPATATRHMCDGPELCASAKCCVDVRAPFETGCPARLPRSGFGGTGCTPTECTQIQYRACHRSADCPSGKKCQAIVVETPAGDLPLGICR